MGWKREAQLRRNRIAARVAAGLFVVAVVIFYFAHSRDPAVDCFNAVEALRSCCGGVQSCYDMGSAADGSSQRCSSEREVLSVCVEKQAERRKQRGKELAKEQAWRDALQRETRKKRYREEGQAEKRKAMKSHGMK